MAYKLNQSDIFDFASSGNYETRQKGDELEFRYCPYCGGGSHKDEWTFAVNLDSGAFKCLRASCDHQGHFVELCRDFEYRLEYDQPKIYRQLPQKRPETRNEAVEYMKSRGISEAVTRRFNITVQNEHPNVLVFPFYDETGKLMFIKYRKTDFKRGIDKNKEWSEKDTMPILFGMDQCKGFDRLIITEGQIDSLSVIESGIENAVSVPTGANGFTWFSYNYHWITQFREIIVFGDCEHGAVTLFDGLSARLPQEVIVKCVRQIDYLGEKDANDILRNYGPKAIQYCIDHAEIPALNNVKQLADVKNVDINKIDKIRTGIVDLDKCIRGMAMGQLVVLTGKRGEGKSTLMSQIVGEALDQQKNVFVYSGELADYHFKHWLDLQLAGNRYILDRQDQFKENDYYIADDVLDKISLWYRNRAYIYDNNYITDGSEFETLPETVEKAIQKYNVELICIDNLMTAMEKVQEQTNLYLAQSNFVGQLKAIAMKYSVVIILVVHPRKSNANDTADDNDLIAGSADITNKADIVLRFGRCDPEKYDCDGLIKVTKNRIMGTLRTTNDDAVHVKYDRRSRRISGITEFEQHEKVYGWEKLLADDQKAAYTEGPEQMERKKTVQKAAQKTSSKKKQDSETPPAFVEEIDELPF